MAPGLTDEDEVCARARRAVGPAGGAKDPEVVRRLPPIFLFHGTADLSVPAAIAVDFADALRQASYDVQIKLYPGKSHTDAIIEDLLEEGVRLPPAEGAGGVWAHANACARGAWGRPPRGVQVVSDDLMTDVITAVYDGHLPPSGRRYSRPSFVVPESPHARGSTSPTAASSPAPAAPAEAPRKRWTWRGERTRRSVLPRAFVAFARKVNPF